MEPGGARSISTASEEKIADSPRCPRPQQHCVLLDRLANFDGVFGAIDRLVVDFQDYVTHAQPGLRSRRPAVDRDNERAQSLLAPGCLPVSATYPEEHVIRLHGLVRHSMSNAQYKTPLWSERLAHQPRRTGSNNPRN